MAGVVWTPAEVDLVVADYLDMLDAELSGRPYSKAEHNERLRVSLEGRRSRGSVEFKHQNISAVLVALGSPHIEGYLPRRNFQGALRDALVARAGQLEAITGRALRTNEQHEWPTPSSAGLEETPPPAPRRSQAGGRTQQPPSLDVNPVKIDWAAGEARNRNLGLAGELAVLEHERGGLRQAGRHDLAGRVSHESVERGDGLGYDIRSFTPEGAERLIEVKTTVGGIATPFYVTPRELLRSQKQPQMFVLARVYAFHTRRRVYFVNGPIDRAFKLEPTAYRAHAG